MVKNMNKPIAGYLKLLIKGGDAKPAPPIAPALGSKGLSQHMMEFCKQFNARTQNEQGRKLRVLIEIYQDKTIDFFVKTQPAAICIREKLKIDKGSAEPNRNKIGSLTWADIQEIASYKMKDLNTTSIESAIKMIAGTARSMGVTIQE
jgi:large subunit ribosomal protein L11